MSSGEETEPETSTSSISRDVMTKSQAWNLYTSHFLSTWNIRTYEFAAVIFTASVYPDTLVATSIRGIVRTLASILFSSSVGRWVDHSPDRLKTLLRTISINRIAVISASILWFFIVELDNDPSASLPGAGLLRTSRAFWKGAAFALILVLGIFEGLSGSGNMLSMERDWVVAASSPDGLPFDLTHLNSSMRRIDLICKLIAPVLISVIISATAVRVGVLTVGAMSMLSWVVEAWCAKRAWVRNSRLKVPKNVEGSTSTEDLSSIASRRCLSGLTHGSRGYLGDFQRYFASTVWIPSLSLAFLHISALAYNATFITYLLTLGFSLDLITLARAIGSVVEISSTIVTPVGVSYLGRAKDHGRFSDQLDDTEESSMTLVEGSLEESRGTETGLERLGLWGISFQLANLLPVVLVLWSLSPNATPPTASRLLVGLPDSEQRLAFILFFFLSISRLGLWVFDLTTQQLTQTMTISSQRSSFTGVEYSFVSLFELAQHILTIVFYQPEQFKWIALTSLVAVATSAVAYAGWVWKMRGHLVHWERIEKACRCAEIRPSRRRR